MPVNDELGRRMKEYYENIPKNKLMRRTPVAIRLDGKAFHSFTRDFWKPFDDILIWSMQETMLYLCKNIQGCVFGYCQSDEITLILIDYQNLDTSAWFDYEVQKICSIAASMATMAFNKFFNKNVNLWIIQNKPVHGPHLSGNEKYFELKDAYKIAIKEGAMFDARCFNIPKEEVTNLIYWRQLDAIRNSIQMVGQANFSQKELQNKSCEDIKNMLREQKGIDWDNNIPIYCQRGTACKKIDSVWKLDTNMPILKGTNRDYVDKLIFI